MVLAPARIEGLSAYDPGACRVRIGLRRGVGRNQDGIMFAHLFSSRKRAASREFEVALYSLLHDAEKLLLLLKQTYKDEWSGFIDDILNGARPYEEATVLIGIFLQQSFRNNQDRAKRDAVIAKHRQQ